MTFEQLRIFVAVAEREHMTDAARALNLTQSAVSAAIAALEARHAVRLFDRVGRGIVLTNSGRLFLGEARAVLARAGLAEIALAEIAGLRRGTLRLVASQTIVAYWLPPMLANYRALHPGIDVDLSIGNTERAAALVEDGQADLGFVEGQVHSPALAINQVGEDRLLVVESAAASERPIDLAALTGARWISRERGSGTRSTFDAAMRAKGIDPLALDIAMTLPSNESVRTAVEAGAGIAALSALVVAGSIEAGRLRSLPIDLGPRPFFAIRHKERYASRAAEALLAALPGTTGQASTLAPGRSVL